MTKKMILDEINKEIKDLELEKLKEVFDFIRFLKYREEIDPTLEILLSEKDYNIVKEGLQQKYKGKTSDWNDVK